MRSMAAEKKTESMMLPTEMNYWRRSTRKSRVEKITDSRIRVIMAIEKTTLDDITNKKLLWFGHAQ